MAVTIDGTNGVSGPINVTTDSIKLDGNYPVATGNVALGDTALDSLTSGTNNTAIGSGSLTANTTGAQNNAIGANALDANTTGANNNAMGKDALGSNITGNDNTAIGTRAMANNTSGLYNVGIGFQALQLNTTGANNTAIGNSALQSNTTASQNTAVGYTALTANTTGTRNTAVGYRAGDSITTAVNNTIVGHDAGITNTTNGNNTFFGTSAGKYTTGQDNTFVGSGAGADVSTGTKNTIIGRYNGNQGGLDIRTSSNNIVLSDGDGNVRAHCDSSGNWSGIGGGKVLQVVQAYKTNTFDTNSTSFVTVTGLAPSITPSSASSKILILANVTFGSDNGGDQHRQFRILRGATLIYAGDGDGSRTRAAFGVYAPNFPVQDSVANVNIMYLDSPSTTSAVTYNFQCRTNNGGAITIGRTGNDDNLSKQPRTPSSIILMEIAG